MSLNCVSEEDLRHMARQSSSMYLNNGVDLTEAVTKVASGWPNPLTSEHIRRVCEMAYHDTYETAFRDPNTSNVVSFDPPEAEKIAAAVRAQQVQTFREKVASAEGGGEIEKVASQAPSLPETSNPFLAAVGQFDSNPANQDFAKLEAQEILKTASREVKDGIDELTVKIASMETSESIAMGELRAHLHSAAIQHGMSHSKVAGVCARYLENAHEKVAGDLLTEIVSELRSRGAEVYTKEAQDARAAANMNHPLAAAVTKVASIREIRFVDEAALEILRRDADRLSRELTNPAYARG